MNTLDEKLTKVSTLITNFLLIITPLFFLPITREFIIISKVYFFVYAIIGLLIFSLVYVVLTRKIVWQKDAFINGLLLLLVSSALSVVVMTPNKMQALFLPYGGFVVFFAFVVYYLFLTKSVRTNMNNVMFSISLSGAIAAFISVIAFVQPFKNATLPAEIAFLNSPNFNTVGNQLDLLVFLLFALVTSVAYFFTNKQVTVVGAHNHMGGKASQTKNAYYVFFTLMLIASILQIFQIGRSVITEGQNIILPPFSVSWFSAIEILKNPFTAVFGVGLGNFSSIFTQVKDAAYNSGPFWQVSSFNISRTAFMHVLTEMGILGATAIGFIFFTIFQTSKHAKLSAIMLAIFGAVVLFLMPPSFMNYFVFFTCLAFYAAAIKKEPEVYVADLGKILPLFIAALAVFVVFIAGVTYFTSTTFASEVIFKRSLDAVATNDLRKVYENQRNAIIMNPSNEEFRRSFSQVNLIVANNIAGKKKEDITDQDRETITQAIQASIAEAKAAVNLNPRKVSNWQYLASVYRNIIYVAKGSELWTIASYQRAILLDPQNPIYRLELGGVYYLLKAYPDAQRMFEQAVSLKPDWANANYNLAWSYYQQGNYTAAAQRMQAVVNLINPNLNKADADAAKKDLKMFMEKAKEQQANQQEGGTATDSAQQTGEQAPADDKLILPTPPVATLEPGIDLPEDASPSANITPQAPFGR